MTVLGFKQRPLLCPDSPRQAMLCSGARCSVTGVSQRGCGMGNVAEPTAWPDVKKFWRRSLDPLQPLVLNLYAY